MVYAKHKKRPISTTLRIETEVTDRECSKSVITDK